jgi:hypothetical protein
MKLVVRLDFLTVSQYIARDVGTGPLLAPQN